MWSGSGLLGCRDWFQLSQVEHSGQVVWPAPRASFSTAALTFFHSAVPVRDVATVSPPHRCYPRWLSGSNAGGVVSVVSQHSRWPHLWDIKLCGQVYLGLLKTKRALTRNRRGLAGIEPAPTASLRQYLPCPVSPCPLCCAGLGFV